MKRGKGRKRKRKKEIKKKTVYLFDLFTNFQFFVCEVYFKKKKEKENE